jgi:hypothetical protein
VILTFKLHTRTSWNDYFTGSPATTLNSTEYTSRQTPSVSSVYVFNCLFNKCTISSGDGGALYLSTSVTYFFVESSSFFSCKTNSGQGGAIYMYNSNCLQSVLYSVCCNNCSSTNIGLFARIVIKNAASSNNYVNYTSIVRCSGVGTGSQCTLYIDSGKIYCPSLNMSMNKAPKYSGIIYGPSVDSSSVTSLLSYSTFADNSASKDNCIWCNRGGAIYEIKCCNIIRNTQVSASYGIIFARGNLAIEDSCILENAATYIFYQESTSYTITLSNCTVDTTTYNRNIIIQNTVTKGFIHGMNHISTQNCHSEYDSAGTLTALIQLPASLKKQTHYCTCGRIFHHHSEGDFFSFLRFW